MKLHNSEFEEFEKLSLSELHKRAYESIDREEYPFNDDTYEKFESEEFSINEYVKNPYDYGSEEYLSAMEKINLNREQYRKKVLDSQIKRRICSKSR